MWGDATFGPLPDPFVVGIEILEAPARFTILPDAQTWVVENLRQVLIIIFVVGIEILEAPARFTTDAQTWVVENVICFICLARAPTAFGS